MAEIAQSFEKNLLYYTKVIALINPTINSPIKNGIQKEAVQGGKTKATNAQK